MRRYNPSRGCLYQFRGTRSGLNQSMRFIPVTSFEPVIFLRRRIIAPPRHFLNVVIVPPPVFVPVDRHRVDY